MNKLDVTLGRYNKFSNELVETHHVTIMVASFEENTLQKHLLENLSSIHEKAAKLVAASLVDYNLFYSDSAYLDTIDTLVNDIYLEGIKIPGVEYRKYEVISYDSDYNNHSRVVLASCVTEAEFQARLQEAIADNLTPAEFVAKGISSREAVEEWEMDFEERDIRGVKIAKTDVMDATDVIRQMMNAAEEDHPNLKEIVLTKGTSLLSRLPSPEDPGIVCLEDESATVSNILRM